MAAHPFSSSARRQRKTAARVVLPCLVVFTILFIFSASLKTGDESGRASQSITALISGAETVAPQDPLETFVRKAGHFLEYSLLGLLLLLCLRAFTRRIFAFCGWPLLAGLLVAVADECIQLFVEGRTGMVSDVVLDFCGVLFGTALGVLAVLAAGAVRKRRGGKGSRL